MVRILVVEDDDSQRRLMCSVLERSGYAALPASDVPRALEAFDHVVVDLIVLDVMLPGKDGLSFARDLRASGIDLPILMVTSKRLPADKRAGFLAGTDDYLTKPVDFDEMLLRIRALLRRSKIASERRLTVGAVTLNADTLTVTRGEDRQTLPQKEFQLLHKLLSYPNHVFTRRQLMDEMWGVDSESQEGTVSVHVTRLRRRFEGYPEFELASVRGLGYKAVVHADGGRP